VGLGRLSGEHTRMSSLENDSQLEAREHHVPVDGRQVALPRCVPSARSDRKALDFQDGVRMLTASTLIQRSKSRRWPAYRPDGMGRRHRRAHDDANR
jgi:hypothetical protein